ncbi:MAG: VUT family protein [Clostridia bacterium]|nr:VUT family protein [Clostridia bacterium]
MNFLKNEIKKTIKVVNELPSILVTIFVTSVVCMNLLANKSIDVNFSWLALDSGMTLSWLSFLIMDIVIKKYGASQSIRLSVFSVVVNLVVTFFFFIVSILPGVWGEAFSNSLYLEQINNALNNTISNNLFIVFGSTVAFLVSAIIDALVNELIGKKLKKDTFCTFAIRSYLSTMLSQFCDNLVFSLIVSVTFFDWTIIQCLTCSLTGAIIELICEIIFSPLGYNLWVKNKDENRSDL